PENEDAAFRYESAERAYEEERYLSVLVDAAYIKSYSDLEEITKELSVGNEENALTLLKPLLDKEYKYIWPIIFRNHAAEISKKDKISALRIALIADNLETYFANAERIGLAEDETQIGQLVIGNEENKDLSEIDRGEDLLLVYKAISILTLVASIVFISFVILRIIGRKNQEIKRPKWGGKKRKK
ncbi:MAG: hypothetical protein NZ903_02540, partial [Candidatus Micrarchaeota archaeon]|nr:hypothetical protein [Candidatus Micrarchaeota archaeon]